jgi:hypothetical protein
MPIQPLVHADVKGCGAGWSQLDCAAILGPWENWIPESGGAGGECSTSSTTETKGANNAETVWNTLSQKGLKPIAIAGIMGNFSQETYGTFDPAVKQNSTTRAIPDNGDGKTGFGIAQWTTAERQAGLFAKLREANLGQYYGAGWGHPEKDKEIPADDIYNMLTIELDYAWDGDSSKISDFTDQLNATTTVAGNNGSTVLFHRLFERSGDDASGIKERINDAAKFLEQFGGTSPGSCAGELGGVSTMEDAIAWANRFNEDTAAKYHNAPPAVATAIPNPKTETTGSGAILSLATHPDSSSFICWGAYGCDECTTLSGWFVTNMTNYTYQGGNGGDVVGNLGASGVPTGKEPRPLSVFSYSTGDSAGHTGVVLGVLEDGSVITLENNWPSDTLSVRKYNIKQDHPDATFAYVADKLKDPSLGQTSP